MSPEQLRAAIAATRAAATRLARRRVDDVIDALDAVMATWLQPGSTWMKRALAALPQATGFSAAMIEHGLPLLLAPLHAAAIRDLLDDELGSRACLDAPTAGSASLLAHVLSGNLPALAAAPGVLSLALKRAVLVKAAAGDAVFPTLLAESIAAADPELAACLIIASWRGGDRAYEDIAFPAADVVVASGTDAAIDAIRARVPSRFIAHGHKVSFAAIAREELADLDATRACAARLAYDMTLWDQQGCLSPQLCYVETGGAVGSDRFAELLAGALAKLAVELPPRRLSLGERAAVLRFRQEAEWSANASTRLLSSRDSTAWSISVESGATFLPTCLNRCIRLKVIADLAVIPAALDAHRKHLEAAGVAAIAGRLPGLSAALSAAGVHRVCALGTMQTPGLDWRQGGRPRVAEWIAEDVAEITQ